MDVKDVKNSGKSWFLRSFWMYRRSRASRRSRVSPKVVHVGVEKNLSKGYEEVEDQPYLYHLDIGGGG